jgi:DNA-binding transcriptional regulator YhcF (GntR family)
MQFHSQIAIYLQIAEYIGEKILSQSWTSDDKVPSIRELAFQLEVNPNTVQRTYDFLQAREVIFTKRGLGYFVSPSAEANYLNWRKEQFEANELPIFFKQMAVLKISFEDLKIYFDTQ